MSKMSFDPQQLLAAAGKYAAAADEAHSAESILAGLGFDAGALGGTGSAAALGSALLGFTSHQAAAAAGCTAALGAFAKRLQAVSGLGETMIDQTSSAAH